MKDDRFDEEEAPPPELEQHRQVRRERSRLVPLETIEKFVKELDRPEQERKKP